MRGFGDGMNQIIHELESYINSEWDADLSRVAPKAAYLAAGYVFREDTNSWQKWPDGDPADAVSLPGFWGAPIYSIGGDPITQTPVKAYFGRGIAEYKATSPRVGGYYTWEIVISEIDERFVIESEIEFRKRAALDTAIRLADDYECSHTSVFKNPKTRQTHTMFIFRPKSVDIPASAVIA